MSWYYFFGKKDRERGIFVGLWAPTFLALGEPLPADPDERDAGAGVQRPVSRVQRMVRSSKADAAFFDGDARWSPHASASSDRRLEKPG